MISRALAVLACAAFVAGAAGCAHPPSTARSDGPRASGGRALEVVVDGGPLVGRAGDGVREWLGVPFAAPPLGALRWKPPAPVASWTAPRDATHRGHACVQPDTGFARDTSEDCLTLNVWAPAGGARDLPVMVWIHGGAFFQGTGSDASYDGARLAARARAVVVTINYRLGALGFLSHRELARELGRAVMPSLGLLDQRAALAWVRRNIGAFGGDGKNVTLFGESAGAWSVCTHLASPGSRGLFARAIMESGACSDALYFTPAAAEAQGDALAAAVGCSGPSVLACLRAKSADTLAAALPIKRSLILPPGVSWGPVVDGVELPRQPLAAMRAGDFARVPLLIGWNRDEGVLHTIGADTVTPEEVEWFVRENFGAASAAEVPARYPRATPKQALNDIITDGVYACNARRVARVLTAQHVPVYLYEFMHPLDAEKPHLLGATHSVELFFVWGNPSLGIGLSAREEALSRAMMDAWGRFARSGDPGDATLRWPRYTVDGDEHLELDLELRAGAHAKRDECDFWDRLAAR